MALALVSPVGPGAPNRTPDALAVQRALVRVSAFLDAGALHPGLDDGKPGAKTLGALRAFQGRFWASYFSGSPDGRIDPGGITARKLAALVAIADTCAGFPLAQLPAWNWQTGMRAFAANRSSGRRAHAGSDLYAPLGTPIYAVADGRVVRADYYYYNSTHAVEVDHGTFTVVYGEVLAGSCTLRAGERVKRGQKVAEIGHLAGIRVPSDMCHLETLDNTESGAIAQKVKTARRGDGRPFVRRRDLIDSGPLLRAWSRHLPSP